MSDPTTPRPREPAEVPPVCPRHTQTVAYVRCQRCGRPTCPSCQRPAAVGIQCVDCVAEGARSVRGGRTAFGGRVTDGRPVVTYAIIGLCMLAYAAQWLLPRTTSTLAFSPAWGGAEPWRFLTSAFVHSTQMLLHLPLNMYVLWSIAQWLEPALGRARFLAVYLISALGGAVAVLLLAPVPTESSADAAWFGGVVGASGAVFGMFGALLLVQRRMGMSSAPLVGVIAVNFVFGFVYPNISWQGHLGGLVTGLACGLVLAHLGRGSTRDRRSGLPRAAGDASGWAVHWAGLALVTLVLVGLAVAKYAAVCTPAVCAT